MKKSIITIAIAALLILAAFILRAQQVLSTIQTNYVQQWTLESTPSGTTLGTFTFTNQAEALLIGIQLGNMTNASGQKLFNATYLTNRLTTATFVANCTNSVTPWWISLTVQ